MKRRFCLLAMLAVLSIAVAPAKAATPAVEGEISGVEVCPQAICGAAIFTGTFKGTVGGNPTAGFFWVAVNHEPLPTPGSTAAILSGRWNIATPRRAFSGPVLGGTIFNSGDNTFKIDTALKITRGGSGLIDVSGLLNHNEFPPTIEATLFQP